MSWSAKIFAALIVYLWNGFAFEKMGSPTGMLCFLRMS